MYYIFNCLINITGCRDLTAHQCVIFLCFFAFCILALNGEVISYELVKQFAIAVLASGIFYLFQIYIPQIDKEKCYRDLLIAELENLHLQIDQFFNSLSIEVLQKKITSKDNLIEIAQRMNLGDRMKSVTNNLNQHLLFGHYMVCFRHNILHLVQTIRVRYPGYLNDSVLSILRDLEELELFVYINLLTGLSEAQLANSDFSNHTTVFIKLYEINNRLKEELVRLKN